METKYPIKNNISENLAQFVIDINYDCISEGTKQNTKLFYLDYIASVHAGYQLNQTVNFVVKNLIAQNKSDGCSHIFFSDLCISALDASFLNAFYAHGADMDDGNKHAAGHIGCHVISALLALAEIRDVSFKSFYEAMIAGYEVYCRLSSACMPYLVEKGFHSTGTAGALASAVAVAKLLNFNSEDIVNTLSLAATQASGLLLAGETRQDMKPINAANAARTGVLSALLVEKGIIAPLNPLESSKGWLHAMTPKVDMEKILGGLGDYYCIDFSYLKLYPSCRHTHAAIDAALYLRPQLVPSQISSIEVVIYGHAIDLAGKIEIPSTIGEAKFSIKYAVALAIARGHFNLSDLQCENITEVELELIKKIELSRNDRYEQPEKGIRGAKLIVHKNNGLILEKEVLCPKGDPENPCTSSDIQNKLIECFSDETGNSFTSGARSFLDWYVPILSNIESKVIFPYKKGRK